MRQAQRLRYVEKIERVVQYLQQLDWSDDRAKADVETLASIARLSPYHFHRVFRLITGEPIGSLVRGLRVARSIVSPNGLASVTEQAMRAGYATPQSFARAVRDVLGSSPSALLKNRDIARELQAKLIRCDPTDADSVPPLSIEIASIEPFKVHAIRNVGAYGELNHAYDSLYACVFAHAAPESLRGIFGVPIDDALSIAERDCRFFCAVRLDVDVDVPAPVQSLELGGGLYVVARHIGSYDLAHSAIDALYAALMESDAVALGDAPIHLHYLDDPEQCAERELRADIYVPIELGAADA